MDNSIPIVLVLWEHPNFGGIKRTFVSDEARVEVGNFNDKASSIGVHAGPGFAAALFPPTVSVFENPDFTGAEAVLGIGTYPALEFLGFNDNISSVRFNTEPRRTGVYRGVFQEIISRDPPAPISDIPLVLTLTATPNGKGPSLWMTLVEPSRTLQHEYGSDFNDSLRQIYVAQGPTYAGHKARAHRDPDFLGGYIEMEPTREYLLPDFNFLEVTSSIEFVTATGARWPGRR